MRKSSDAPSPSCTGRSKKLHLQTSQTQSPDPVHLSSVTPDKTLHRRTRNRGVALSIADIRKVAEGLQDRKQRNDTTTSSQFKTARRRIVMPSPCKTKNSDDEPFKLPEKYEILGEFFDSLDCSIRLLRLKRSMPSFTNISSKIECLTDRRFTHGHLAQLKFILPEAIVIKKILVFDELTSCMKPDLHVTIDLDAVEPETKLLPQGGSVSLRKLFRSRLRDFCKSHPKGSEIPEETLPEPFNHPKKDCSLDMLKTAPSSSLARETHLKALPAKMPSEADSSERLRTISPSQESSSALPATLSKPTEYTENKDSLKSIDAMSTPAKLVSTPSKLMTATPALPPPKRHYMSPEDNSTSCLNKLVRRPPRSRSLKFDTPVKNKEIVNEDDAGGLPVDDDIFEILPQNLLQSIREKERKAMEERDPAISEAKRRKKIIAGLPKLFNMIHLLFRQRSVLTKEELVSKIISCNCDIVDRSEVEEQLNLLLELVPEWISEKLASSGDFLFCINKLSNPEMIRASLEEAK